MEDILIISEGGQLLYSWHPENKEIESDDLISGFLTALNTFATVERGEDLKSIKLKETNLIFEKHEEYVQKLIFVITYRNENLIELVHAIIHNIMDRFTNTFKEHLQKDFDGEVAKFRRFDQELQECLYSYGFDVFQESIREVNEERYLKSIIYLEPKSGHLFYIHAKHYVNKEKLSFLIPLIINSSRLLYRDNLNETIKWVLLTTVRNENLIIEPRDSILIVKQYQLPQNIEEEYLALNFFKNEGIYLKKPKKIIKILEDIQWNQKIKEIFLVDLLGKIIYSRNFDENYDYRKYIPEALSFLTSTKKASNEIYSRVLFNSTIVGEKSIATVCLNLNNMALIIIGNVQDFNDFQIIQEICLDIFNQIKSKK